MIKNCPYPAPRCAGAVAAPRIGLPRASEISVRYSTRPMDRLSLPLPTTNVPLPPHTNYIAAYSLSYLLTMLPSLCMPCRNPIPSPSRYSGKLQEPHPRPESSETTSNTLSRHLDAIVESSNPNEPHTPSESSGASADTLSVHANTSIDLSDSHHTTDSLDLLPERSMSPEQILVDELRRQLLQAEIYMDDGSALIPRALQHHIKKLQEPRVAPSPKAKEVQRGARLARLGGEANAGATYAETLLLNSWCEGGHEWVDRQEEIYLNNDFDPPIVCPIARNDGVKLITQAHPDSCMGYVRACRSSVQNSKPFNKALESYIDARWAIRRSGQGIQPLISQSQIATQREDLLPILHGTVEAGSNSQRRRCTGCAQWRCRDQPYAGHIS
jgi:hypothetical protein